MLISWHQNLIWRHQICQVSLPKFSPLRSLPPIWPLSPQLPYPSTPNPFPLKPWRPPPNPFAFPLSVLAAVKATDAPLRSIKAIAFQLALCGAEAAQPFGDNADIAAVARRAAGLERENKKFVLAFKALSTELIATKCVSDPI